MSADFYLKQHLNMSPNAKIKNLVPETLESVPPEVEWKLGRIWFNNSIGKFQCVILKMDSSTGLPIEPNELEVALLGSDEIGFTRDGEYYPDGLFNFNTTTKVSTAVDEINEALKDLAPAEASPLNGQLDITVSGGFKTGRVSKQNISSFYTLNLEGISAGDSLNYIISTDKLVAELPTVGFVVKNQQQTQFGKADQGVMKVFYDGQAVDSGVDLLDSFNESSRDYFGITQGFLPTINQNLTNTDGTISTVVANPNKDQYRSPTDILTINTIERYNDFKKWQKGDGIINLGTLPNQNSIEPGRHTFYVEHSDVLGGNYTTSTSEIFYDPDNNTTVSTIDSFTLLNANTKFISGVEFLNDNIQFNLDLTVNNAFAYTYWDYPIQLTLPYSDAGLVVWNDASSSLSSETIPFWNDTIVLTDYVINYNGTNNFDENIQLFAKAGKVSTSWGNTVTTDLDLLIDTHPILGNSTYLKETFNDEDYRLFDSVDFDSITTLSTIGDWVSSDILTQFNAQQYMGKLQIAQDDYSVYGLTVDYTLFQNDIQNYFRPIMANNKANSNGQLKITTNGTIGIDFDIYIKFPTITAWLDTNTLYDSQDFVNGIQNDGTGCASLIDDTYNGYTIDWTIGTNSTIDSGYGYMVKIIMKNKNISINEIEEISPNWR